MSSELRKSLESIQSLLESNPSPMTATSLSSRMQRASLEAGMEQPPHEGLGSAFSPRGSGSLGGGLGAFQPSAGGTLGGLGSPRTMTSSLAPIAEPGASHVPSPGQGEGGRDSLSYTPFDHSTGDGGSLAGWEGQMQPQQQQSSLSVGGGAAMSATQFQTAEGHGSSGGGMGGGIGGSPSSAFSAVNKLSPSASAIGMVAVPPFGGTSASTTLGLGAGTTPGNNSILSGARASASSAGASSRVPSLDMASIRKFSVLDGGHHAHGPRRETSLLVSPVSQRASLGQHHGRSPQSELSHASPSVASIRNDLAAHRSSHVGPTGTPVVASANSNTTPATAGLTVNLQPNHTGRDPTPYRYRDHPSTSPPAAFRNNRKDEKKVSDASSRSGKDPPAKSPLPTSIKTTSTGGAGFLVTSKSTPNVHSHHYHKDQHHQQHHSHHRDHHGHHSHSHHAEEHELSMIEEDASLSGEDHHSMVSNVTGSTFVRTPNMARKLHGGKAHGGGCGHHTPRSHVPPQTPGSASTAFTRDRAATPSQSALLHRPSLAMRDSMSHLATSTTRALDEVWDAVGVSPDDRAAQLADLVDRVAELCESKVREEEGLRDQFRKEIEEARREWSEACQALRLDEEDPVAKMRRDPSSKDLGGGSGMSLQNEYEAILARLESLRGARESATKDLEASRDKMHEAYAALHGCTAAEAARTDEMQPFEDVRTNLTLARREEFRGKAAEYEENVAARSKAVVSLLLDCQALIRELEIVPPAEVDVGRCEDDATIMTSLAPVEGGSASSPRDQGQRRPGVVGRSHSDQYSVVSLFETPTCIGISNSALDRLTGRIAELNGEKNRRRKRLGDMGTAISALWKMLRIPHEEQKAFTASIRGLGLDTIRKGEAEIARLEELKSVVIGKLVREQREAIRELWEKTNSSAAERASFDAYYRIEDEAQINSDLLKKHEDYVASLESKLEKMQPILDLIAKREAIIEERVELEFMQKDPDRLKGRGAAKQLMKEEKMDRRVKKELPKITTMLERTLKQWYAENKPKGDSDEGEIVDPDLGHFMYQGAPYLQTMECQEEEWRTRKERGEQERQRKRDEERAAASSAGAAFGYSSNYTKLPGKKWNPTTNAGSGTARPRSASTVRSGSKMRSGSNMRGGSHPTAGKGRPGSSNNATRSGSNMRFGGRGPLGDVSSSKQNASRPPSRPRGAPGGGADRSKKVAAGAGRGYRPASAPRMRL